MRNGKPGKNGGNGTATKSRPAARSQAAPEPQRLPVLKTYKIYIGGKFPRTESGRYYMLKNPKTGEALANVCQSSRKDFREAVVAARAAQSGWAGRSAYNRAQILYRIAEMLEGRAAQFVAEMVQQGYDESEAKAEVTTTVDRLVLLRGLGG